MPKRAVPTRSTQRLLAAGLLALAALPGACKKEGAKKPAGPAALPTAVPELGAAIQKLHAAVLEKRPEAVHAAIDPELAIRVDASLRHYAARPVDQLPIAQAGEAQAKEAGALALKRAEIATIVSRSLVKEKSCAFAGQVALRTPLWPTKPREGWAFVIENGKIVEHLYDTYVQCKNGYNVELRFARRRGSPEWKLVAAQELPFGVSKPPPPPIAKWD